MDKAVISSSSSAADDADSEKCLSVSGTSQTPACSDLPVKPVWMVEDTLLVYSPQGLCASDKVVYQNCHVSVRFCCSKSFK